MTAKTPFKDSNIRSITKGISWRLFASIDTFLISWIIFGNYMWAGSIALMEILTKILLYYLHERLWNKIPFGRTIEGKVKHIRSIVKSISWRTLGTIDTAIISLIISGSLAGALTLGLSEIITKIFLFYMHERLWARIHWGRIAALSTEIEKK